MSRPDTVRAALANDRDTGARGLRSIVEEVMTDVMFELPDIEDKLPALGRSWHARATWRFPTRPHGA